MSKYHVTYPERYPFPQASFHNFMASTTTFPVVFPAEDKQILKEIIVVDDGSRPPLRKIMSEQLLRGGPGVPKMKIVRHEHTLGLISAKKSGVGIGKVGSCQVWR